MSGALERHGGGELLVHKDGGRGWRCSRSRTVLSGWDVRDHRNQRNRRPRSSSRRGDREISFAVLSSSRPTEFPYQPVSTIDLLERLHDCRAMQGHGVADSSKPWAPPRDWVFPSKIRPTTSASWFSTGEEELPPMISFVVTRGSGLHRNLLEQHTRRLPLKAAWA